MPDLLFDDGPITDALVSQRRKALAAVDAMPADAMLASPLGELAEEVMAVYRIPPLVIDWDRKTVDVAQVQVRLDANRTAAGTSVTYFIPYSGATGLFHLRPTAHRGTPPSGIVRPGELLLTHTAAPVEPSNAQRDLAVVEISVRRWVGRINQDVERFSRDLADEVEARLATRRAVAQAAANLPSALGLARHERSAGLSADRAPERSRGEVVVARSVPLVGQAHPGRPAWTAERYAKHLQEARGRTPNPHVLAAVAAHFRTLDDEIGVSPEWLGRLQRRFRPR
jgi:hypothetical protein